ncbi:baseplate megatron protein TIM-barrel domain-containing protein [Ovoidimarina sediminis]|uniref:baseplate megatron protein TIM-barrel domain-containing protein n=1 Tax=Ovoidimarina sediminis TaxID=3079856 RepID=UPI002913312C|nr:glycoside hydrolase TIM-barrel-like domain-containing protein [Rhodophyticola sp. MJ-SS7]MDU8945703.1 glycoside hydrolase TIM-barrel-like domain-containing protein [Rhodophyticola sp. MJ-SS7]
MSTASLIACGSPGLRKRFLDELDPATLTALPYLFEFWALSHQIPPEGHWKTWLVLGGRGAGKTRAGAEWVRSELEGPTPTAPGRSQRMALVAETLDQARDVMVYGESGIIACSPPDRRPEWEAGRRRLIWPNGATAQIFSAHEPESLRGPQFDAAWCDEIGCPAVDKGTNAPNLFIDPKSSESGLPPYSSGRRDDFIQRQALTAILAHFADPAKNPVSPVYGGPMLDLDHAFVWAWDARPFPFFPSRLEVWSDGENYQRGHWLNGRISARSLSEVVRDVCGWAGVTEIDVARLYGVVRGFRPEPGATPRAVLQALMLAHGFDAVDRDGVLAFRMRSGRREGQVDRNALAVTPELTGGIERVRAPGAEVVGRVRVNGIEAEGDYQIRASDAVFPDETSETVTETDLPMLLTAAERRGIAERWLAEARIARDTLRFALPPSRRDVGAGDVVEVDTGGTTGLYRIDRLEQAEARVAEGQRVEPGAYVPSPDVPADAAGQAGFIVPVPVEPVFLDLPLLRGDEVPHAPHLAVSAAPWPGPVAAYKSASQNGFVLAGVIEGAAVIGETLNDMVSANPGVFDRGSPLRVKLWSGALASVAEAALLNGANAAAIGNGADDLWEVFQFAEATLVDTDTYDLSLRLRGQAGTDAVTPATWPAGSRFVLLTKALRQLDLDTSERQLARTWRVGPASRPVDDPVYEETSRAFDGVGLRPYAPVHLSARPDGTGGHVIGWIRRTRIDGDSWAGMDVPLGEETEAYLLRISAAGTTLREETLQSPGWIYTAAYKTADAAPPVFDVEVAQLSARFGPGPFRRLTIHD